MSGVVEGPLVEPRAEVVHGVVHASLIVLESRLRRHRIRIVPGQSQPHHDTEDAESSPDHRKQLEQPSGPGWIARCRLSDRAHVGPPSPRSLPAYVRRPASTGCARLPVTNAAPRSCTGIETSWPINPPAKGGARRWQSRSGSST